MLFLHLLTKKYLWTDKNYRDINLRNCWNLKRNYNKTALYIRNNYWLIKVAGKNFVILNLTFNWHWTSQQKRLRRLSQMRSSKMGTLYFLRKMDKEADRYIEIHTLIKILEGYSHESSQQFNSASCLISSKTFEHKYYVINFTID